MIPPTRRRPRTVDPSSVDVGVPVLAGAIATVNFAVGMLPMVVKAARTKDLRSYSRSNIVLSNVGNAVQSVYVFSLPAGPIWALHSFYLATTALMLLWHVRYTDLPTPARGAELVSSPDAADRRRLIASEP
jgi:hypothetical protein